MNHATGAVAPLDQEMIQVGHAIWQRAERRGLIQGSVRPVVVVQGFALAQNGHEVPLIPDQGPVQQFSAAVADPPLEAFRALARYAPGAVSRPAAVLDQIDLIDLDSRIRLLARPSSRPQCAAWMLFISARPAAVHRNSRLWHPYRGLGWK